MSLWCGACRKEIFYGFGLLYRMPIVEGLPRTETNDKEYVPPNSAICYACWALVPSSEHLEAFEKAIERPARHGSYVFGYSSADSGSSPIWGSKQWSDIERCGRYVYLRADTVRVHLPRALDIIRRDASEKGVILFDQSP